MWSQVESSRQTANDSDEDAGDYENADEFLDYPGRCEPTWNAPSPPSVSHEQSRISSTSHDSGRSSGFYSGGSLAGLTIPQSPSPGSKQSANNRTSKEQYPSTESSDSEHEYIDPDFPSGTFQPEETRHVPPSTSGNAGRLGRKPGSGEYDDVINTVRITAVKNNLRPTIMSSRQQSINEDEEPEFLTKFSEIRKWSAEEIKASHDPQNAGPASSQQFRNTTASPSGMNAGRKVVQLTAVAASGPKGDQSRGRGAITASSPTTKSPTLPDYVNVAPFVKPKSSPGGPVTKKPPGPVKPVVPVSNFQPPTSPPPLNRLRSSTSPDSTLPNVSLSPGASTPASKPMLNRRSSEPAADVPAAVKRTGKKVQPKSPVGQGRAGIASTPPTVGQAKKCNFPTTPSNPMHRAKSATSLIPDHRGLTPVSDDVPPELPPLRPGHAIVNVVTPSNVRDPLSNQSWYFGNIDRETSAQKLNRFLRTEGTFLVRRRENEKDNLYSIDVVCNGQVKRVLIRQRVDKRFAIGSPKPYEKIFSTVPELISFYSNNGIELADYPLTVKLASSPPK